MKFDEVDRELFRQLIAKLGQQEGGLVARWGQAQYHRGWAVGFFMAFLLFLICLLLVPKP